MAEPLDETAKADVQDAEMVEVNDTSTDQSGDESVKTGQAGASRTVSNGASAMSINKIQKIKVRVQAMLGGISMTVAELANLKQGDLIALDTKIGEAIDIMANGQVIARGEIVVVDEATPKFGITLTEVVEIDADAL